MTTRTRTTRTPTMKTTKRRRSHHRPKFFFCLPLVLFFYFAKTTTKTTRFFFEVEGKEAKKVKPSEEDFGAILISEIMYNPIKTKSSESSSPEVTTDDTEKKASGEWVEFLNPSGTDEVDVSGWFFSDEKNLAKSSMFQFPSNTTIKPKERIVVAKNVTKFEIAYGENEGASNVVKDAALPFRLNNKGEKLLLLNAKKEIVHEVEYNDKAPWPIVFAGYSIELTSQKSDANDPFSWVSSLTFGGTPGRENSVELVNKLVNN
jgi:hypothetical protein